MSDILIQGPDILQTADKLMIIVFLDPIATRRDSVIEALPPGMGFQRIIILVERLGENLTDLAKIINL